MLSCGTCKCRSSRDAEHEMRGMLTSGKVPLEKTLMEKSRSQQLVRTAATYAIMPVEVEALTLRGRSFRRHRRRR